MEDAPPPFWAPGGLRFDKETSAALDAAVAAPLKQTADPDTRLEAKWNAAYEPPEAEAYDCMIADEERANKYQQAIKQRMAGHEGEFVVVDIGTGPYALLALMAARAGAKRVYAIEASPWAARRARSCVERATDVPAGVVTVIDGLSTDVTLPEKADLLVAELVGSVCTEEGLLCSMRDAVERHVLRPDDPASYIPVRCQTMCAPASHALHYVLAPPSFDWVDGLKGQALRTSCWDTAVEALSTPQLLEDVAFHEKPLPPPGTYRPPVLEFTVGDSHVERASANYLGTLRREGLPLESAAPLAAAIAHSLSGLACWPRLELDVDGEIVLESRGPNGEPVERSEHATHWQTVLPLLAPRPVPLAPGDTVRLSVAFDVPKHVDEATGYELKGDIQRGGVKPSAPVVVRFHRTDDVSIAEDCEPLMHRGSHHDSESGAGSSDGELTHEDDDGMEYTLVVEPAWLTSQLERVALQRSAEALVS